jgi:type I restriction enzyme, S subunit
MKTKWREIALGEVATLHRGYDLPVQDRLDGAVPVFAANGVVGYHSSEKVAGPAVVTGRSGTIGKVHYSHDGVWPLNTALYVSDFHGNHPRFVFWLLRNMGLERFTSGTGVPTLNRNLVHPVQVRLPPIEEQRRVAAILDKADELRAKRRAALAHLGSLTQSIFLDMFADPRETQAQSRKDTQVRSLGSLATIRTGKLDASAASADGPFPFFTCAREPLRIDRYDFDGKAVLVAGNGDLNVKYFEGRFNAYQRTYVIESRNENEVLPRFLHGYLDLYVQRLRDQAIGGVIKYIKLPFLADAVMTLPSLPIQVSYSRRVEGVVEVRRRLEASASAEDLLFASLQHRAFAGKL